VGKYLQKTHSASNRRLRPAGNKQVNFRPYDDQVFAISNIDPFFESSVLSRGLIAEHQGELWVASPLKNSASVCVTACAWKMRAIPSPIMKPR
jgi:nitrite reductase/ring-hydroxylating ferredoxin subunit